MKTGGYINERKEKLLSQISLFVQMLIIILFFIVGGIIIITTLFFPETYTKSSYYSLMIVFIGLIGIFSVVLIKKNYYNVFQLLGKIKSRYIVLFLTIICLALRLIWVLKFQIAPDADYATFYEAAKQFSYNFDISYLDDYLLRYIALFPHIYGYSSFLGIIFKIFGVSVKVASITNVILSTICLWQIYFICKKISGEAFAILAAAIWTFYPSQIIYNMFVLSEPYYTTLLLLSIVIAILILDKIAVISLWKSGLLGMALGIVLTIMNSARPVALIMLVALIVVFFVIYPLSLKCWKKKCIVFGCLMICFLIGGKVNSYILSERIGESPATIPGFNILVGFNETTNGRWSQEDSNILSYYNEQNGKSAQEVQKDIFNEAIIRIKNNSQNWISFFYAKTCVLWQGDEGAVLYGDSVITHPEAFKALSNGVYNLTWIFSLVGVCFLFKKRKILFVFPLYIIGLTLAHMMAEVAMRYHYSGIVSLTILSAYGITKLLKIEENMNTRGVRDEQVV